MISVHQWTFNEINEITLSACKNYPSIQVPSCIIKVLFMLQSLFFDPILSHQSLPSHLTVTINFEISKKKKNRWKYIFIWFIVLVTTFHLSFILFNFLHESPPHHFIRNEQVCGTTQSPCKKKLSTRKTIMDDI